MYLIFRIMHKFLSMAWNSLWELQEQGGPSILSSSLFPPPSSMYSQSLSKLPAMPRKCHGSLDLVLYINPKSTPAQFACPTPFFLQATSLDISFCSLAKLLENPHPFIPGGVSCSHLPSEPGKMSLTSRHPSDT